MNPIVKTKHGNRILMGEKPIGMSRTRYGIAQSYADYRARHMNNPLNLGDHSDITSLFFEFYDPLHNWGKPNGFGYITVRTVEINPVGGLFARRYFLSKNGKKRLEYLRRNQNKPKNKFGGL